MDHYDIIIIGTGAGGGTLAHRLAPTGKKILILERGDFIPREKENWSSKAVFEKQRYTADEPWLDRHGKEFIPGIHYGVGGNTKFYGAALLRLRERDFGELQHAGGTSPAWDLSYQDLAPHYLAAERLYCVHGQRGADPTEPPEDAPYPLPPIPNEPRIQELFENFQGDGLHPFPLPLGVRPPEDTGQPAVVLDRFDGYPDPTLTKADAHSCCILPALKHPNVTLVTNCFVDRLETGTNGKRISKVVATRQGESLELTGDLIAVCCGAVNSAALLLRSAAPAHPNGLANGSDVVGRYYMAHNNSVMLAMSTKRNDTRFGKTIAVNDFYFGDTDYPYPLGHIQMVGKSDGVNLQSESPIPAPLLPLEIAAKHSLDFWLTSEDLPEARNRVTLTKDNRITLDYYKNNMEGHERLQKRLERAVSNFGMKTFKLPHHIYLQKQIPLSGTAHQVGTVRFGDDPNTSALNTWCRSHEVENLFVVDGSFFPSIGAVNPSLTIMAMALRVGGYIAEEVW